MNKNKVKHAGFTLAELLIVIAIIAVLVAVAIPVFNSSLEKTRAAVCSANRRSLMAELANAELLGGNMETTFQAKKAGFACPEGGTITYSFDERTGVITVRCSKHNPGFSQGSGQQIVSAIDTFLKKGLGSGFSLDSNTASKNVTNCKEALGDLDPISMGAAYWAYRGANKFLYWSTVDVSTLSPGAEFPVIRYNGNSGTYTVWTATAVKSAALNPSGDPYNNMIMGSCTAYTPSTGQQQTDQTLKNAQELYDQLLAAMNP